jgi:hypothetical protein
MDGPTSPLNHGIVPGAHIGWGAALRTYRECKHHTDLHTICKQGGKRGCPEFEGVWLNDAGNGWPNHRGDS